MSDHLTSSETRSPLLSGRERRVVGGLVAVLLGTGCLFRVMRLSSVPGINGDEGWWGMQAIAWLSGRPYERYTTSGNPIDQIFLIPLALLHGAAPPSFLLLRALPVLVNLAALPIAFWLVRRVYGTTTAWIHTVALAILPTAIAHSRITQDPSQTVFWTGLVIYLSLLGLADHARARRYLVGALLLFPVALWTHPTNIFIGPFLVLPCLAALRPLMPPSRQGRTIVVAAAALAIGAGLLATWFALRQLAGSSLFLDRPWHSLAAARLGDVTQWFEFAVNGTRLLNGVTIYHYFSGARPTTAPYDVVAVIVIVALACGLFVKVASARSPLDYGLVAATAGTLLAFYAFAGPQALRPHYERWGLCLIVPVTLVLARGLTAWIEWRPARRWWPIASAGLVAASLLATFYGNYFHEFATTGGRSHLTYVTAAIEPKRQALDYIIGRHPGPDRVLVETSQWWLGWPIAYLATEHLHVSVTRDRDVEREPGFADAVQNGRLFFVEFAGTPALATRMDWVRARGLRAVGFTIRDASGRALVEVLEITAAAGR